MTKTNYYKRQVEQLQEEIADMETAKSLLQILQAQEKNNNE